MVFNSSQTFNLEQLKAMLALMPNPVVINKRCVNESGEAYEEVVYLNPVFESTLGYTIEDIPTHEAWFDKAYPDRNYQAYIIKEWRKSLETAAKNRTPLLGFTCKVFTKKGAYKWFEVTSQINSNILNDYYLIVFLEVDAPEDAILNLQSLTNELIEKNHELERSKSVLDEVQEIAQIGSWEIDLVENTISWSPELFNIFMEDPATHVPTLEDFYRRLEPEEATLVQQQIEQAIQTGEKRSVVVTSKRGDGSPLNIEIYGRAVYDELSGQPIKLVGATMDISDRVELLTENGELAKLIRVAQQELYIVDYETDKFVYVNESASRNTGYSIQELLDFTVHDINPQLTPERVKQMKLAGQALDKMHNTSIHQRKDGSIYPVHATLQRVTYKNRPCYAIFDIDITELKAIEQILDDQLKLFENIIDSVPVRIYWKDLHGAYLGANKHFLKDAELQSNSELIGKTDLDLIWAESSGEAYLLEDLQVMESGVEKLQVEEIVTKANGERMVLSNSKIPLTNTKGEIVGILGTYEDITQRRKMQDELMKHQEALHHQAHHDLLTNLPNRLLLQDRLVSAARHAKRSGQSFAVMFIDLDQFKQINDAMGHDVGDRVLQEIARRLYAEIGPIDTLARIGGDEFTIIKEAFTNTQEVVEFAQKIIDLTKEPILIDSQALYLSSSIGISLYPKDTTSIDDLLKYADAAMYRAKDLGRNNVQFYTEDMTQMAFEHVAMQASLRQAIKNHEFVVAYQPQVDAAQHKVMGMEALVRWNHPLMGMVQPNKFIPLAESTGMIVELDRLVMQSAMLQWVDWQQQGLDLGVLSMNLSVKQIQQADFIDFLQSSLLSTQCHPDWLCLEVTESAVMKNLDEMKAVLIQIRALGISIAVDDFGTGYSSLAYLKRLPVSKLKIDRSFIRDLPDDEEDATITRTIIIMAKNLGLEVIAEGVETAEQQAFLLENGCPDIQGFLYAQPLLKAPLEAWLTEFNAQGA